MVGRNFHFTYSVIQGFVCGTRKNALLDIYAAPCDLWLSELKRLDYVQNCCSPCFHNCFWKIYIDDGELIKVAQFPPNVDSFTFLAQLNRKNSYFRTPYKTFLHGLHAILHHSDKTIITECTACNSFRFARSRLMQVETVKKKPSTLTIFQ